LTGRPGDTKRPPRRETNPRLLEELPPFAGDSLELALPSAPNRTCLLPPTLELLFETETAAFFCDWLLSVGVTDFALVATVVVDAASRDAGKAAEDSMEAADILLKSPLLGVIKSCAAS